jgi:hypothetical protein
MTPTKPERRQGAHLEAKPKAATLLFKFLNQDLMKVGICNLITTFSSIHQRGQLPGRSIEKVKDDIVAMSERWNEKRNQLHAIKRHPHEKRHTWLGITR